MNRLLYGVLLLSLVTYTQAARAEIKDYLLPERSTSEIHYQYGNAENPFSDNDTFTTVITATNASTWKWGATFFFVDYAKDSLEDDGTNFNDENIYLEAYLNLSLSKLFNQDLSFGAIKDVGLVMGTNYSRDPAVVKYTPGMRLSWDVPGFAFINTDFMAYIDDSAGTKQNTRNAPAEENSWFIDVNYLYPFEVATQKFMVTGHAEFIKGRELDDIVEGHKKDWFLAQTQIRWDAGHALFNKVDKFYLGTEWQYWNNKLGSNVDENMAQFLAVFRF
jgi:nucleoside-specific outer membrane channel protein Tsx